MRAKQALRPETVTDPYAGFAVCDVIDDDLPEIVISAGEERGHVSVGLSF